MLLLLPTAIPDDKLCLEKLNEFGLGRGRVPVISNGAHIAAPDMLKNLGKDLLEGVMTVVGNWSGKGQEQIMKEFVAKTNEPWITQDSLSTYGDMWIFKEALEKAAAADRRKVADAIRTMDATDGPAKYFPGGRVKFDDDGAPRRRRPRHRAVAERAAGHRLSGRHRHGAADLAAAIAWGSPPQARLSH